MEWILIYLIWSQDKKKNSEDEFKSPTYILFSVLNLLALLSLITVFIYPIVVK